MSQFPWMPHAWAELGVAEAPGPADNPRIVAYSRRLGQTWVDGDETPWCAAFVGHCLESARVASTRSLAARSYLAWGVPSPGPSLGAIVVLSRGADPAAGHVGFLVGWSDTRVWLLGGNQSNAVTVAAFDRPRVLGFRLPPPLSAPREPAAVPTRPAPVPVAAEAAFADALAMVLAFEGGWSDDPFDPGGPTNKGITLAVYARERGVEVDAASYPRLKSELRHIPDDLVARIYRERYWRPCRAPELPPPLALFHFDTAVNMGVGTAARLMQRALGVEADGEIGPITLAAARSQPGLAVLDRYAELRRARYRSLSTFWRFGRGWLRRLDEAVARAKAIARATATAAAAPASASEPRTSAHPLPVEGARSPMSDASDPFSQSNRPPAVAQGSEVGPVAPQPPKWWGESLTIWGAILTGLTTVAPAILAAVGVDLPADLAQRLGRDVVAVVQAVGGLAGTLMTIAGRARASAPIVRRPVTMKL